MIEKSVFCYIQNPSFLAVHCEIWGQKRHLYSWKLTLQIRIFDKNSINALI